MKIKRLFIFLLSVSTILAEASTGMICHNANGQYIKLTVTDSLPDVFNENNAKLIENNLRHEAAKKFAMYHLPQNKADWNAYRVQLKKKIVEKTGVLMNQKLPLNLKETGSLQMNGYSIKNIAFQTRPGIYATANLYVPGGTGKFPGVIVMMGHSAEGRLYDKYQAVGITLALNGYVSLCIDPWGSGERTTVHGVYEDHGDENNLGAQLLNIGESLMGMELTDNIRGLDLLSSLPYVDRKNLGATGSSGGGNQTMWLAAMDERVKAAVPVVSAGTFEAFVMGSPCICEVLTDALTFTEESAILALIAPRALKMCNHQRDANAAFKPAEMLRSYNNLTPIFKMMRASSNLTFDTFDLTHGYWPEDRQSMLGWFNLHLKGAGTGSPVKELSFNTLPAGKLMVYPAGKRHPGVLSTEAYCKRKGNKLRAIFLNTRSFNAELKRNALKKILRLNDASVLKKIHEYSKVNGWNRFVLESSDDKLIPVLLRIPSVTSKEFVIMSHPDGKQSISNGLIDQIIKTGSGIAIVDLSGTGEMAAGSLHSYDSIGKLRTLSKSYLLLGKTLLGEWVKELDVVAGFIRNKYKSRKLSIYGSKETGLAGLYLAALKKNIEEVTLQYAPVSYLFDNRENVEFFSTAIHLPGFLHWGDISLAAALGARKVRFINPVTMSGQKLSAKELQSYKAEFEQVRLRAGQSGNTFFD